MTDRVDDAELVTRAERGEKAAFEELVQRHYEVVVSAAYSILGDVDAMKRLQGWTDTNIIHFHDLARYGERLLLSIRHISWSEVDDPLIAQDWAISWKPEIQGYIHAYRMATGVSLSDDVVEVSRIGDARYLQPSIHLRERLSDQRRRPQLPAGPMDADVPRRLPRGARVRDW